MQKVVIEENAGLLFEQMPQIGRCHTGVGGKLFDGCPLTGAYTCTHGTNHVLHHGIIAAELLKKQGTELLQKA